MFEYVKKLNYPINVTKKDLRMAKYINTALGGSAGEMGASLRYWMQKYTMPDNVGRALLNDIACEELGHIEMIGTLFHQLTKDASAKEMEEAGLGSHYADHGTGVFPSDASGIPFSANFSVTSDVLADISEDMAAEQKARASYENLINLADDEAVIAPLLFLRQREVVHYNRFKSLFDYYKKKGY